MTPATAIALKVAAAALVVGIGIGGFGTHAFYSPRLDLERQKVRGLGDRIAEQNTAIEALKAAGEEQARLAKAAVGAADAARKAADKRVGELLGRKPPPGVDDCTAASTLIREELKR